MNKVIEQGDVMNQIRCGRNLTSIEDIHDWLNKCSSLSDNNDPGDTVNIDLSKLGRISPAGCIALLTSLKSLDRYFFLNVTIPERDGVIGYMERMDFFKHCPDDVKIDFELQLDMETIYNRQRHNTKNKLLEIHKATKYSEVGELCRSIKRIIGNSLVHGRVSDLTSIASELANNAIEHGKSYCLSCIQYYPSKRTVEIAIGDEGIGIFNSISKVVIGGKHHVIKRAILTRDSRHKDQERGKGLLDVKARAFDWSEEAEIYLRTHDSAYRLHQTQLQLLSEGSYFRGTFYYLVIYL
ncbi:hypothetical protein [Brevibacillus brevis]|uniref:hypothetical protein n=1 Tax=Brevibacillus brevis TaxID=1393 RepID=UPI000F816F29|nr:hypothetical protein [Brevibacillus brevis]GEC92456.1 hypothetical protein BBR01nite_47870 [Brevibacillus brevis]